MLYMRGCVFFRVLFVIVVTGFMAHNAALAEEDMSTVKRQWMVDAQIKGRDVTDKAVLAAMAKVERHLFVPSALKAAAYEDMPLPIGQGQTISQPYIVAYMTAAAQLQPEDRVLEIGTGSGYQAAILAEIVKEVYTIEIVAPLADKSRALLAELGYKNVEVKCGDGYKGWPDKAPFDAIIVTAAPAEIPMELAEQLQVGGRMVVPVGSFFQELYLITRTDAGFEKRALLPVRFVPMVHPDK